MIDTSEKLRIDKYLWAIRLFKTRSLAAEACKAGRVKLDGQNLKPSYVVKIGDVYTLQKGPERKVIKVVALLENRVDAKKAITFYEDVTPLEDTAAYKLKYPTILLTRDPGTDRPTKKDRRAIDNLNHDLLTSLSCLICWKLGLFFLCDVFFVI